MLLQRSLVAGLLLFFLYLEGQSLSIAVLSLSYGRSGPIYVLSRSNLCLSYKRIREALSKGNGLLGRLQWAGLRTLWEGLPLSPSFLAKTIKPIFRIGQSQNQAHFRRKGDQKKRRTTGNRSDVSVSSKQQIPPYFGKAGGRVWILSSLWKRAAWFDIVVYPNWKVKVVFTSA